MAFLNRFQRGGAPKWLEVASALKADFARRIELDDLRLPTEADLAREHGVAVVTVRQALASLKARGLVEGKRKTGTVIRKEGFAERSVLHLARLSAIFEQQRSEWTEVLEIETTPVPSFLAASFPGQKNVLRIVRRRFVGVEPGNHAVNHVRLDVAAELDFELLKRMSITEIIHDHTRFTIGHVDQQLVAEAAEASMAASLGIALLSPVMLLTGRTYDKDGALLDAAEIVYRGDAFRFVLHVPGA